MEESEMYVYALDVFVTECRSILAAVVQSRTRNDDFRRLHKLPHEVHL